MLKLIAAMNFCGAPGATATADSCRFYVYKCLKLAQTHAQESDCYRKEAKK